MSTTANTEIAPPRIRTLDGLRGVAVSMVLLFHCFVFPANNLISKIVFDTLGSLWMGVDLFFALSGYLITRILLSAREKPNYFRNFYMRRVARIWPAYLLVLILAVYIAPLLVGPAWTEGEQSIIPWMALQFTNWAIVLHAPDFPWSRGVAHFWSLGAEEQFYLIWPIIIAFVPLKRLFVVCLSLFFFGVAIRFGLVINHQNWTKFYMMPLSHMDGLIAGSALAVAITQDRFKDLLQQQRLLVLEKIGWAGLLIVYLMGPGIILERYSWLVALAIMFSAFAFTGIVYRIHYSLLPPMAERALSHPAAVWMGRYSYGIYLLHYVLLFNIRTFAISHSKDLIDSHPNLSAIVLGVVVVSTTLILARLMFQFIELPALNWGARYSQKVELEARTTAAI